MVVDMGANVCCREYPPSAMRRLQRLMKFRFPAANLSHTWVNVPAGRPIHSSCQTCIEHLPCFIRRPQRSYIAVVGESHGDGQFLIP